MKPVRFILHSDSLRAALWAVARWTPTAVGVSIFNFPLFCLICRFEKHFFKILLADFGSEHAVFRGFTLLCRHTVLVGVDKEIRFKQNTEIFFPLRRYRYGDAR